MITLQVDETRFFLDSQKKQLWRGQPGSNEVDLTPIEWEVLNHLAGSVGVAVEKSELLSKIWGNSGEDYYLTKAISEIRRKLGDREPFQCIKTVRGRGYRLVTTAPSPLTLSDGPKSDVLNEIGRHRVRDIRGTWLGNAKQVDELPHYMLKFDNPLTYTMVLSITSQTGVRIAGSATFNNKTAKPFQTVLRFTGDIQDNRYLCLTLIDENPTHIHEVWAMFDVDPNGDQMKGFWLGRRVREHGISLGHMVVTKEPHRRNGPSHADSTADLPLEGVSSLKKR